MVGQIDEEMDGGTELSEEEEERELCKEMDGWRNRERKAGGRTERKML